MPTRLSSRQSKNNATLTRVTAAANSELDDILSSLDSLVTPPLVMSPNSPANQRVNIGSVTVTNPVIGAKTTVSPLNGSIPAFTSGYVDFPTTSGSNAVPSAGSNLVINVSSGNFIKVGIAIDTVGNINLTAGTQGGSIVAAGTPSVPANTIPVGFVVLQNIGGTIQTITGGSIYQYVGAGSGGGGGGSGYTTSFITAGTTAVSGTQYLTNITTSGQTITLPSGATNARIMVSDASGQWANFPVTVQTTGGQLISLDGVTSTSLELNVRGTWIEFIWTGSYWATDTAYFPTVTVLSVSQYIDIQNQASAPAAPSSGNTRIYTKTDGKVYKKDSSNVETSIGGGMSLEIRSSSFNAIGNTSYLVSTTGGAVTATLPTSGLAGTIIRFTDIAQTWGNPHNLILNGGTNNIYYGGQTDTQLNLNLAGTWLEVLWDSANSRWATRDAYYPLNNEITGSLTVSGNLTVTGALSVVFSVKSSAYTATHGDQILANTSGGAFTITLPSSPTAGQNVRIFDAKGTFAANNLTVARNGSNINGAALNFVANVNDSQILLVYVDVSTGWKVFL